MTDSSGRHRRGIADDDTHTDDTGEGIDDDTHTDDTGEGIDDGTADDGIDDDTRSTDEEDEGYEETDGEDEEDGEDEGYEEDEEDEETEGYEETEETEEEDEAEAEAEEEDEDEDEESEVATPKHPNSLKWGLVAVSVLAVVAIALVAVVLLGGAPGIGTSTGGAPTSSNAATSGIVSANDTGPVTVITEDPSCAAWTAISTNLSNTLSLLGQGGWVERDQSIPASAWDDEQKKQYLAAGQVLRSAAAQTIGLVKLTPHRVMRELYEQFIAYSRAFIERIPNYTEPDATLEGTANSAASALAAICASAANGAAAARGPLLESPPPPMRVAQPGNPTNPQRYLTEPNPVCRDWKAALDKFGADTVDWQNLDPNIPATYWNPQQKQVNLSVAQVMIAYANKLQQLGRRSDNPTLQDFADLSSQYRRAFVLALPTYSPADNYLANAASYASTTVLGACAAASRVG